jgi:hypothetical protein
MKKNQATVTQKTLFFIQMAQERAIDAQSNNLSGRTYSKLSQSY